MRTPVQTLKYFLSLPPITKKEPVQFTHGNCLFPCPSLVKWIARAQTTVYFPGLGITHIGHFIPSLPPLAFSKPVKIVRCRLVDRVAASNIPRSAYLGYGEMLMVESSVCIGMRLAQLELRHTLANSDWKFEGGVKPSSAELHWRGRDADVWFLISPKESTVLWTVIGMTR